ncbi:MAG: s-methyl-5-thioribose-1-phosphate isomerase, partial [Caloramator sp.]|nr:s-methyl-5-thioribose-1-phosphate isomerase [Caloramator sp.]
MKPIIWSDFKLHLLDQRLLPIEVKYIECNSYNDVAECIKSMVVRGAPAIGIAAAYGVVLGAKGVYSNDKIKFEKDMQKVFEILASTRPTAVNLFWALSRMKDKFYSAIHNENIIEILENEANEIFKEDLELNKRIGEYGAKLLPDKCTVLTHCNAGALATAGWGTALGVIRSAKEMGKEIKVFADETRPLLQGARLTAFELMSDGIDVTLISDNMAG